MIGLTAGGAVLEVTPEGEIRAREGDVAPGDLRRVHQSHLEALATRRVARRRQHRPEEHVHLLGMQHVNYGQQRPDRDLRERFLAGLTRSSLLQRLAVLHEPRGNRPIAASWLDRTPAQENAAL